MDAAFGAVFFQLLLGNLRRVLRIGADQVIHGFGIQLVVVRNFPQLLRGAQRGVFFVSCHSCSKMMKCVFRPLPSYCTATRRMPSGRWCWRRYQQHTNHIVHHLRGGGNALGRAGHAVALGEGGNHVGGDVGIGVVQQQHLFVADVQQRTDSRNQHDDDGGQDAGQHHVLHLGHFAGAVDLGGLIAGGRDGNDGGKEHDGIVARRFPDTGNLIDGTEEARLIQQAPLGHLLGDQPQIAQQLGNDAHVGGQGALLDQHGHQGGHDHGGHELGQVGHHLVDGPGDIGLDLIEEECQNDGHGEAEAQSVEAQQEGVSHGPPELGGLGAVTHQQHLEIGEAGEQLLRHGLHLVGHLKAAQQLVHGEIPPEQEHQQHGNEH